MLRGHASVILGSRMECRRAVPEISRAEKSTSAPFFLFAHHFAAESTRQKAPTNGKWKMCVTSCRSLFGSIHKTPQKMSERHDHAAGREKREKRKENSKTILYFLFFFKKIYIILKKF